MLELGCLKLTHCLQCSDVNKGIRENMMIYFFTPLLTRITCLSFLFKFSHLKGESLSLCLNLLQQWACKHTLFRRGISDHFKITSRYISTLKSGAQKPGRISDHFEITSTNYINSDKSLGENSWCTMLMNFVVGKVVMYNADKFYGSQIYSLNST